MNHATKYSVIVATAVAGSFGVGTGASGGGCPPSDHDCCTTGGPGCADSDCCGLVCAVDPFCCDTAWDSFCVGQASSLCGRKCGSGCDTADHDCATTGGPGCTDTECCDLVCAADPFCCTTAWDGFCVSGAFALCGIRGCPLECTPGSTPEGERCGTDINGGCGSLPPIFGSISCGETICGTAWLLFGIGDTDWYQITLDHPTEITLSISSELSMIIGVASTGGVPDCALATVTYPYAISSFCGTASLTTCLVEGTHWLIATPSGTGEFACDGGANEYELSLICTSLSEPCPNLCEAADHDCCTSGTPGCTDLACCDLVCTVDPLCCETAWDSICIDGAVGLCGIECGVACPASDEDCFTGHESPGCAVVGCCEYICAVDPFCCDVAWDGLCASAALIMCSQPAIDRIAIADGIVFVPTNTPGLYQIGIVYGALNATGQTIDLSTLVTVSINGQVALAASDVNHPGPPLPGFCDFVGPPCSTVWKGCVGSCEAPLPPDFWKLAPFPLLWPPLDCQPVEVSAPCPECTCVQMREVGWNAFGDEGPGVMFRDGDEIKVQVSPLPGSLNEVNIANDSVTVIFATPVNPCPGDFNGDGFVDGADLGNMLGSWGAGGSADLNGDGVVDGGDLGLLLGGWGPCP